MELVLEERDAAVARPFGLRTGRGQTAGMLAALGPFLARGGRAYCIDGGNAFNPLTLARELRRHGLEMETILRERIFVSRAFTCHQLLSAVETLLPPLATSGVPTLALLLKVEEMFLDEDLALRERQFLFDRLLDRSTQLQRAGLPLIVTFGAEERNPWVRRVDARTLRIENVKRALPAWPMPPRDLMRV